MYCLLKAFFHNEFHREIPTALRGMWRANARPSGIQDLLIRIMADESIGDTVYISTGSDHGYAYGIMMLHLHVDMKSITALALVWYNSISP